VRWVRALRTDTAAVAAIGRDAVKYWHSRSELLPFVSNKSFKVLERYDGSSIKKHLYVGAILEWCGRSGVLELWIHEL